MKIGRPASRSSASDSAMQSRMPQRGNKSENISVYGSKMNDPEFPSSINNDEGSNYFEKRELITKAYAPKQARISERNMEDWDSVQEYHKINRPTMVSAGVSASIHPSQRDFGANPSVYEPSVHSKGLAPMSQASRYSAAAGDSVTHNGKSIAVGDERILYDMESRGASAEHLDFQSIGVGRTSNNARDVGAGESVARDYISKGQQNSYHQASMAQ